MFFEIDDYTAMKAALAEMCSEFLRDSVPENAVFDCRLVANELLSNALRYGGGAARFRAERRGDRITISVKSSHDFEPPANSSCSGTEAESGRGLFLVDAVSESRLYDREKGICVVLRIEK
ncbi:MAG: ATP-binding protein [Clostridia bacterium]|nr:ATP-binding protein [Clostridia bacterium]